MKFGLLLWPPSPASFSASLLLPVQTPTLRESTILSTANPPPENGLGPRCFYSFPWRPRPDKARPDQTKKNFTSTLFWPERASYKSCEALDTTIPKLVTRSSVLEWSQPRLDDSMVLCKGSKLGFYIIGPCFVMNGHPRARMELSIGRIETIAYYLSSPNVSGFI